jgi:hypothetical protein
MGGKEMTAEIVEINRYKKAMDFLQFSKPERFVIITADDPIEIVAFGDMTKAEMMGTLEIAKLMIADEV